MFSYYIGSINIVHMFCAVVKRVLLKINNSCDKTLLQLSGQR